MVGILHLFAGTAWQGFGFGLVIAALGLLVNIFCWPRYRKAVKKEYDAVIAVQQRLYRVRAFVDIGVVTALSVVMALPGHVLSAAIDAGNSLVVAAYLVYHGIMMAHRKRLLV